MCGKIELILGCMFSGKTGELLRRIKIHNIAGRNVMVIKWEKDLRYSNDCIATHDECLHEAVKTSTLAGVHEEALTKDVIAVDEGQFYPDLVEYCEIWANEGKTVIVAALDGKFDRSPWTQVSILIPKCEKLTKKHAMCPTPGCGTKASFTQRIVDDEDDILIGGNEEYKAVCRTCYFI